MKLHRFALAFSGLALFGSLFTACDGEGQNDQGVGGAGGAGECPSGLDQCSGTCTNTAIDPQHCGACGTACADGEACLDSKCVATGCPSGQVECSAACVTLASDRAHCGACDKACGSGELCSKGKCEANCADGQIVCDNTCVDPLTDPKYCGATSCDAGAGGASGVACLETEACVVGECRTFLPRWEPGERLDTSDFSVGEEQSIGMDDAGNALLVWRQFTSNTGDENAQLNSMRPYAAYYEAATKTWLEAVRLDTVDISLRNMKVATAAVGHAVALWVEDTYPAATAPSHVKAASFDGATKTWSPAVQLDTKTGVADTPDVDLDSNGNGAAAWAQRDGSGFSKIYVAHVTAGVVGIVEEIPSGTAGQAQFPHVQVNDSGVIGLVWEELDEGNDIWMPMGTRYSGSAWTTPVDLRSAGGVTDGAWGRSPVVGVDDAGNVTAVFTEDVYLTDFSLYSATLPAASSTWSAAETIEDLDDPCTFPSMSMDGAGHVTVGFQLGAYQANGDLEPNSFSDVYAVRGIGGAWNQPEFMATVAPNTARYPKVRADKAGNVFLFWPQGASVYARRYVIAASTWTGLNDLAPEHTQAAVSPDIAAASLGTAIATWAGIVEGVTGLHLYAARFD